MRTQRYRREQFNIAYCPNMTLIEVYFPYIDKVIFELGLGLLGLNLALGPLSWLDIRVRVRLMIKFRFLG